MNGKKSIKSNIILNCMKTAMSVIFPLITFPYITRILGTANVGKVSFGNSVISYFALAASLGITTYTVREGAAIRDDERKRNQFFNEVFTVNFISTCISFLLLIVPLNINATLKSYSTLLLIQSGLLIFNWIGVEWIFNIYEDFWQITIRSFAAQIVSLALMFLFVKDADDYLIYAAITVIAAGGSYIFNFMYAGKYYRPHLVLNCQFFYHVRSMLFLAANLFAITIYVNSDITMIGFIVGEYEVGIYSVGVKIYTIVKNILAAMIIGVMPRVSYYFLNEKMKEYTELVSKMAQVLMLLCIPAMTGLFMVSDDVLLLFAGFDYVESSTVLKILSFAIIFAVFGSFFSSYGLIIRRKEKMVLIFTVISAAINVGLNCILIPALGIEGAAITTLISEAFVCIAFAFSSNITMNAQIKRSFFTGVLSSVWVAVVCILGGGIENIFVRLLLSVSISMLGVVFILVLRKEEIINNELHKIVKKIRR